MQIEALYGKSVASSIISDCHFKVFFAANDHKTAEHISSLCIDKNEGKKFLSWQQIMSLMEDSQIVLLDKEQPIVSKKIKYYNDKELESRVMNPAKI